MFLFSQENILSIVSFLYYLFQINLLCAFSFIHGCTMCNSVYSFGNLCLLDFYLYVLNFYLALGEWLFTVVVE